MARLDRTRLGLWACALALVATAAVGAGRMTHPPPLTPPPAEPESTEPSPIQFEDVTAATGITFVHTDGSAGQRWMFEPMASGVAVFDYDGDGRQDIYFLTGIPLRGAKNEAAPTNRLYRNEGGLKFTDVTEKAGVGKAGYGLGVAVGDYNNDGRPDLFVNTFGTNVLFRNNGDGTFTDVTREAGVAGPDGKIGAGTCFLDFDGDGFLDLFVSHYIQWSYETNVSRTNTGFPVYSGPRDYPKTTNFLYRNNRDGTFKDVSVESGIAAHPGAGMGCVAADYDNDGRTDLVVANDQSQTFIFHNDGGGKFGEGALVGGIAYTETGDAMSGMGVACADYDNDGWLDFHITAYQSEPATLFRNLGRGLFEDVTRATGAGRGTVGCVKWGNGFADFDNDGHKDIFIASGHLDDNVESWDKSTTYLAPPILLRNTGTGKFVNLSGTCGFKGLRLCGRGVALADLDGDGKMDVVILNSRRPPTILRNVTKNDNHWIQIDLRGTKTNRFGVGAHVKVAAGSLVQLEEAHSGQGYQSHFGLRLHFGLGKHARVDRIEVRWIGGGTDVFENVEADRLVTLTEGTGKPGGPAVASPVTKP